MGVWDNRDVSPNVMVCVADGRWVLYEPLKFAPFKGLGPFGVGRKEEGCVKCQRVIYYIYTNIYLLGFECITW